MRKIDMLIPDRGQPDTAALRAHDPDALARYVLDPGNAWWRRRICADALAGRVPEARVHGLLDRIRDEDETAEVRIALLDLLAGRTELLPWLRDEERHGDGSYGVAEAVLKARGLLGDRTAAPGLSTLAASPWQRWRETGEAGLDGLVEHHGADAILADLGEDRPEDRRFALRTRHRAGLDVLPYLADPDRGVADLAQSLAADPDRLRAFVDQAPTPEAAVRAVCALHGLTEDRAETRRLDERLGGPRVGVDGLDEELRRAVVHEYAPRCERKSDPRWRLEALCTEPPGHQDVDARLTRATAALAAAGLDPAPPVSAGDHHQQGDGSYHVIRCGDEHVLISVLGRFASGHDDGHPARRALEEAGFRWIDGATGGIEVTDLCVYHFGGREPLDVDTLLFYWQD
ncbi:MULTISPECIES: hypothetical protein [Streptomyces]|jgi:hypothetical protein|uniref:HEAT repeat domain-containing protein n=1 Tax=Streptomyces nymphaeiformis TaxID=2663842 RepID=A0A7W7U0L1_9ACTN|nr:hypothetical protein [Streptomyces nymphaeiformis]MBB4982809.1 hypothetical protein [Streptomyces nymphaeiformis]